MLSLTCADTQDQLTATLRGEALLLPGYRKEKLISIEHQLYRIADISEYWGIVFLSPIGDADFEHIHTWITVTLRSAKEAGLI